MSNALCAGSGGGGDGWKKVASCVCNSDRESLEIPLTVDFQKYSELVLIAKAASTGDDNYLFYGFSPQDARIATLGCGIRSDRLQHGSFVKNIGDGLFLVPYLDYRPTYKWIISTQAITSIFVKGSYIAVGSKFDVYVK